MSTFCVCGGAPVPAALHALFFDLRTWSLTFNGFPKPPVDHRIPLRPEVTYSLARILFEAGILLTPFASVVAFPSWFALYRYAHAFTGTAPDLALPIGADDLDLRLLAVLAEEVAVGITGTLARDFWNVVHLDDVAPLIKQNRVLRKTQPPIAKHKDLRPDYLGITRQQEAVFFESKGATGAPHKVRAARTKGKKQVENVDAVGYKHRSTADRVVVASHFPIFGKNRPRATTFLDDPFNPDEQQNARPREQDDLIVRRAYAKILSLAGLDGAAALLVLRQELPPWLRELPELQSRNRAFVVAGAFPLGGWVCFEKHVWETLCIAGAGDLRAALRGVLEHVPYDQPPTDDQRYGADVHQGRPVVVLNNGAALVSAASTEYSEVARKRRDEATW